MQTFDTRHAPAFPAVPMVLITQWFQRDFADPIGPHDPLPNLLHVGCGEAVRRGLRIALKGDRQ
jgi:hypothetical protein